MTFYDRALQTPELIAEPPVLVDIGASGAVHPDWRPIAKYSICVAFDADSREMGYAVNERAGFRKLYIFHSAVTDRATDKAEFFLTRFPYCSSTLKPNCDGLKDWAFAEFFEVVSSAGVKNTTLPDVLRELKLDRIDWFKTDSQGIDLRLFQSLGVERLRRVLSADFEPGILDAYHGEDKLHWLLAYMETQPFYMTRMRVKGSERLNRTALSRVYGTTAMELVVGMTPKSPGWAEASYLNTLPDREAFRKRDILLLLLFAVMQKQYGFALELAACGRARHPDPIFDQARRFIHSRMIWNQVRTGGAGLSIHLLKTILRKTGLTRM